jgi:hypothetical protein
LKLLWTAAEKALGGLPPPAKGRYPAAPALTGCSAAFHFCPHRSARIENRRTRIQGEKLTKNVSFQPPNGVASIEHIDPTMGMGHCCRIYRRQTYYAAACRVRLGNYQIARLLALTLWSRRPLHRGWRETMWPSKSPIQRANIPQAIMLPSWPIVPLKCPLPGCPEGLKSFPFGLLSGGKQRSSAGSAPLGCVGRGRAEVL